MTTLKGIRRVTVYAYRGGWAATVVDVQGRTGNRIELSPAEALDILRPLIQDLHVHDG